MLLELKNIRKSYGGVKALRDGNLSVDGGQVCLLLGENGAGKSTLMKIVAGLVERDGGQMLWNGAEVHLRTPGDAQAIGIAMVHQESLLAPHMTIAENIFLGREPSTSMGVVSRREMLSRAAQLIEQHHFPLRADQRVDSLSPAGKQLVEICRAIQHGSSLLIFDEPTSSLSNEETGEVFRIVRTLCERNIGVIYITHRMQELREIGNTVTILRDGETVHQGQLAQLTNERMISYMVGREVSSIYHRNPVAPGEEMLRVEGLSKRGKLHKVSFTLRAGEIVGLGGLIGAGRTELCQAIFGAEPADSGKLYIKGRETVIRSPRDAVRAGIALVTEDRQQTGLALRLPVATNTTLANTGRITRNGVLMLGEERKVAASFIERLRIKTPSGKQLAGRLSGGNQQKVVVAKWMFRDPGIFLFDEPTRGIDVGAKVEVFEVMDELARSGAAVLMVSSELPELLQVADRILVMRQGALAGELPGRTTQEDIMRLATVGAEAAA